MSSTQHLSDEAVAAFADGVLSGHARDRAARHINGCAECRQAVNVQREAAAALRTAPAPALPTSLADKLRTVPLTTPLPSPPPTALAPDGSTVLSTFAPMAALVPQEPVRSKHRSRTYFTAAVLAGLTGAVVAGTLAAGSEDSSSGTGNTVRPVSHTQSGQPAGATPAGVFRNAQP
jgi:hypothetical protein